MATATTTVKVLLSQGPDQNVVIRQRVRTVGSGLVRVHDNITEGTTVTIWAADNGLPTIDHGWFVVDPFSTRTDGASDSSLTVEISGATVTVAMEVPLEVPLMIPGRIASAAGGALEDVVQIQVKNPNGFGVGDLRCGLALFGR